ncbi:hypothetical protein E2C01_086545 [Portunus trituberculatus]|uniref:Uncharacterized protein n=1 Tax=Portunus trituberculatus TaxID=210409 RepID=A0A5B7J9Z6_PORTR|nr:hypothetical protein [Portunus trituberculatus]
MVMVARNPFILSTFGLNLKLAFDTHSSLSIDELPVPKLWRDRTR